MHSLIEIHPLNPATGNREVVRISSVQDARINSLGGYKWRPCIIEQPSMNINLFDGDFNTAIQTGGGRFSFNIISILRDYPDFAAYALQGCRISIYGGEDNDPWPWVKLFEGNINRFEQSENKFSCSFRVDADKFAIDILSDTYAGTGGADGGSDLENRPKPWIFGFARNVEPLLINVVDNIYQFSSYGPIKEVLSLYERGSDFGSKIDDFADYDALLNADVPPGSWATCNEEGLIRLGAPAAGVITGDVEGDYHDGVFRRSPGGIVKRIAEHLGLNLTDLNIPSLDFVDAELSTWPQNGYVNLVIQNQISLIDLVQALARGCNYQSGVDWLGRLFWVKPEVSLSHSLSLHAQGFRLPKVVNSTQVDVSPPYSTIEMGGVRSHRVHSISEIATDLRLLGGYSSTRVYVLDDVVSLPDNSTWRWKNPENGNSFPQQSSNPANDDWELLTDAIQIDLGEDNVIGTLPVGKAVPELINENITIDDAGVINGIGTVDAAVLNSQVDTGINLIAVGTGVISNNAVTKTGGFGFNGGAYSSEASDSFYVSFKYDFSTFVNRSYVCLSKDAQPDGTSLNNTVAYMQVDGIGDFLRPHVDGVGLASFTVTAGDIPSKGVCTILYDGRICRFFVDGIELFSRFSQDENAIVRALILPQNSGKMTELQSVSYGQANNSTWEQIRNSGSAGVPADNATANVSLVKFGAQSDRISLLANRFGSTGATNNSGVHTLTSHNGSCLLEFTVNGIIGCVASIYDTTEYDFPSDRFTPAKYHAFVLDLSAQDQTFAVQIRQEVDGANLFRGTFTGFNFGDTVGLRYDGVTFALLRNGEVIDIDVAEAGLNVRGSIIPQGSSQGVFAIDEIDWTVHTDNSSQSVGGFGLTEMEIRNPTLTNDGILAVEINGSPINLGAVTISGIGYVGDLNATRNTGALADLDILPVELAAPTLRNSNLVPSIADAATRAQYQNVQGTPTSLADIDAEEGSKLAGIQSGATIGATEFERALINQVPNKTPIPLGISVGGVGNIEFKPNFQSETLADFGEIYIAGGRLITANNGEIIIPNNTVFTSFEGEETEQDPFYVIWGVNTALSRFPNFNNGSAINNIFTAIYDYVPNQWTAVDFSGNSYNFTPLETDIVIATGRKNEGDEGISSLVSHVVRWDGLPENGADVTEDALPTQQAPVNRIVIYQDSNGNIDSSQYNRTYQFKRTRGSQNVSSSSTWSTISTNCTSSVDANGVARLLSITGNNPMFTVKSNRGDIELQSHVDVDLVTQSDASEGPPSQDFPPGVNNFPE